MSEVATSNVTIPAQAEAKVESRSGSGVSWDQLEGAADAAEAAKPAKKETKEPKSAPKEAKEAKGEPGTEKAEAKPAKKPEAKEKAAPKDGEEAEEKEAKAEPKPKAKVHKYRSGDKEVEIAGDSVFTVKVDGKDEEATLEDLRASFSGKQFYERKITEVDRQAKEVAKSRDSLNTMANEIFKRSHENPESAYDYLAQMAGKDPIEFKTDLVRKQRAEALELARMSDDEFESWVVKKQNEWLTGERTERTQRETQEKEKTQEQQQLAQLKETYGLDDDTYNSSFEMAKQYLKSQGQETDPTPRQVLEANRYVLALETIEQVVPHLAKHSKIGSIVEDLVNDMMNDPSITRDQVAKVLKDTFGNDEDDGTLKRLARKAQRNAEFDGTQPTPKQTPKSKEPVSFDDL